MLNRYRRLFGLVIMIALVLLLGGVAYWTVTTPAAMSQTLQALEPDGDVTVRQGDWLIFEPLDRPPDTGFIFYPGGKVPAKAYAPYARAIATEGYLAVIVPMPLNLAILGGDRAMRVAEAYPAISNWVIGGHSLGGVMAARFAHNNPDLVSGLLLLAAYPERSTSLAESDLVVASIYGTLDGLTTLADIESSKALLPPETMYVAISGGNHGQFGWYGEQSGDHPAEISREQQQAQTVAATVKVLELIAG